jgi:hypothetical protein
MAFKFKQGNALSLESPESMFADIKTKRIPGILSQQADILREYHEKYVNKRDLAIQLPTGSGKTLIALLIAEWRRLSKHERVVYLCPTKQLVNQVVKQAQDQYGLNVVGFTGPSKDYRPVDKANYQSGDCVAVTTYSSLFNAAPFFSDPNVIILDDAHAADQYISDNWCLDVRRYRKADVQLFDSIVGVLRSVLDSVTIGHLVEVANSSYDNNWSDLVSCDKLSSVVDELEGVISANVSETNHKYAWGNLSGKLDCCNIYLASQCVYIRPYLSPTFSHGPFFSATQRIYLSATPGEGGELERIFCIRKIDRISPPRGWDKHAIGRRYFVFPELTSDGDLNGFLISLFNRGRVLLLAGDNKTAELYKKMYIQNIKCPVFDAEDIEKSKVSFLDSKKAIAVLANRYDGIDFPNDECRITLLSDIPPAINYQERFLADKMGATHVFEVRKLTRIIQSFGRCTRGGTDYGLVVVVGDRLVSYIMKSDKRQYFHAELQGELLFSIEDSKDSTSANLLVNVDHFLNQDDEWRSAQSYIYELRDRSQKRDLPGCACLADSAEDEVRYMESIWANDLPTALDCCRSVIGKLTASELRGERALWNYFAGSVSSRLHDNSTLSVDFFKAAGAAAPSLSWLNRLSSNLSHSESESVVISSCLCLQLDRLECVFQEYGMSSNRRYDNFEKDVRQNINSKDNFERGHEALGMLLGFVSGKDESEGSPDPWWKISDDFLLVFEDYAGAMPGSKLSVTKARQASTHDDWIRRNIPCSKNATVIKCMITSVTKASSSADCHLDDVVVVDLELFRKFAEEALGIIRGLRSTFETPGDMFWRTSASLILSKKGCSADNIVDSLKKISKRLTIE